jgi:hypothetical protein
MPSCVASSRYKLGPKFFGSGIPSIAKVTVISFKHRLNSSDYNGLKVLIA